MTHSPPNSCYTLLLHHKLSGPFLLFVERTKIYKDDLEPLITELSAGYTIPQARLRRCLVGTGAAFIHEGERSELQAIADILDDFGLRSSIIEPPDHSVETQVLQSINIGEKGLTLKTKTGVTSIDNASSILAIISDASGSSAASRKNLSRRVDAVGNYNTSRRNDLLKYILRSQPVLDICILDPMGDIATIVRVIPSKFQADGLGERKQLSGANNLLQIVNLLSAKAKTFTLRSDIDFERMPGLSAIKTGSEGSIASNLERLTQITPFMVSHYRHLGQLPTGKRVSAKRDGLPPTALPPPPLPPIDESDLYTLAQNTLICILIGLLIIVQITGTTWEALGLAFQFLLVGFTSGVLPLLLGYSLLKRSLVVLRLRRYIEDTPTSKLSSLAMGTVEVKGMASAKYALVYPNTKVSCVWHSESGHVPFLLKDGTGEILVNPHGATVILPTETPTRMIHDERQLYILGEARPHKEAQHCEKTILSERLNQIKSCPTKLAAIDTDGDGHINNEEWDNARKRLKEERLKEVLSQSAKTPLTVIGKPSSRLQPFIIAETEQDLIHGLRIRKNICIFSLGLLFTIWGIYSTITYFIN